MHGLIVLARDQAMEAEPGFFDLQAGVYKNTRM